MEMKTCAYSWWIRSAIVLGWFGIIMLFIYSPRVFQNLYHTKTINIFSWPQLLDVDYIRRFEQESGIKVNVSYFETNEELFVKLKATKGSGYDLIIPSDYTVDLLRKEGLLKKIDQSRLSFFTQFNPTLLNHFFDPGNRYSLPFLWGVYGLGINKEIVDMTKTPASWRILFEQGPWPEHVGMLEEAREVVLIAAQYLFGSIDTIDDAKLEKIRYLLCAQKKRVAAYTDFRSDYLLLSKTCPIVAALSTEVWKAMKVNPSIDFIIPEEGSFLIIDNLVIPAQTTKDELVYQFINFLYQPEVLAHHAATFDFFPPVRIQYSQSEAQEKLLNMLEQQSVKIDFFRSVVPEDKLHDLWIAIKAD